MAVQSRQPAHSELHIRIERVVGVAREYRRAGGFRGQVRHNAMIFRIVREFVVTVDVPATLALAAKTATVAAHPCGR